MTPKFSPVYTRFSQFIFGFLMILSLGWTNSCQSKAPEQPSISDEKVAQIMADLSVANAATNGLSGNAKDSLMQVYFKQVFEIHNITLEGYEKDLRIIAQDLSRMERISKLSDDILSLNVAEGEGGLPKK